MAFDLTDRVALVTGGARGLGLAHARALVERGARVVINDVGAGLDGTAPDAAVLDEVVAGMRARGGVVAVSHHDVSTPAGASAAVAATVSEFGRLDALVANAGILRDRTLRKLSAEDFDAVVRVHLNGSAYCLLAAWPVLQESGTGRVVLTSSASGLYGQFGQANYAAAKAGLVGLLNVAKQEGARHGIGVNAIAPVARTRMTAPLLPEDVAARLDPEHVSPVVAYLLAPECTETGLVLEVGGGSVARVQVVESELVPLDGRGGDGRPDEAGIAAAVRHLAALTEPGRPYPSSADALERILAGPPS